MKVAIRFISLFIITFFLHSCGGGSPGDAVDVVDQDRFGTPPGSGDNSDIDPTNRAPIVAGHADFSMLESTTSSPVSFTISDPDLDIVTCTTSITAWSSNQSLIKNENITISGPLNSCSLTVRPEATQVGVAQINLVATDGVESETYSFVVTVTSASSYKLVFIQEPTDTASNVDISPTITVEIQDSSSVTQTGDNRLITLSISHDGAGGGSILSGTVSSTPVAGVASFSDLSIDLSGTGFTLVAEAAGLLSDTSASFDITAVPSTPTVTISTTHPINTNNETAYITQGTCSENGRTVSVDIGGVSTSGVCAALLWTATAADISGVVDGTVTVTADHDNALGTPAITASVSVTKETVIPLVAITSYSTINAANILSYTVGGTCSDNGEAVSVNIGGVIASSPCIGGGWTTGGLDVSGAAEGTITVTADHTDFVGNNAIQDSLNIFKDSGLPTVTINNAPIINLGNQGTYTVSGGCSEDGESVVVNIGGVSTSTSCSSLSWTTSVIDVSGVADGSVTVTADLSDISGNDAIQAVLFTTKTTQTVLITLAEDIISANQNSYTVVGTCSDNGSAVSVNIGGITFPSNCLSGSWTTGSVDVSALVDGGVEITASHSNASDHAVSVTKDTITPMVEITSYTNITALNETEFNLSGTCSENGEAVLIDIGGLSFSPNCSSGTWATGDIDVSSLADNSTITVSADHNIATQDTIAISKDTSSPSSTITSSPDINISNEESYIVTGTCTEEGVVVSVDIAGVISSPNCLSGAWSTGSTDVSALLDGTITITVTHSTAPIQIATALKETTTPTVEELSSALTYDTSVDLVWDLIVPGGFTIDDYVINYRVFGSSTWLTFADGVSIATFGSVTGLVPSTSYEFRVKVLYDTTEESAWSNIAAADTKPSSPLFDSPYKAMNVGGATISSVVAYEDSTTILVNDITITTINKGVTHSFASSKFDIIDATGPIYTAGRIGASGASAQAKGNIAWQPVVWAGKSFSFNSTRFDAQKIEIFAIENATIEVKNGGILEGTTTLAANSGGSITWSKYGSFQIFSTGSVLVYHLAGGGPYADPKPLLPSHTEVIGFPSNSMRLTTISNGTNYTMLHSESSSSTGSLNKADIIHEDGKGSSRAFYAGDSLLITADKEISGASYADSDGFCAAPFLPTNLMKRKYAINVSADYVAFASKTSGTIQVLDSSDTLIETLTLSRTGADSSAPYKVRRGTTPAGYRFISTTPVAGWYQPNSDVSGADEDETILYGSD